jgi:hypothetical protein
MPESNSEYTSELERIGNLPVLARSFKDHSFAGSTVRNKTMEANPDKSQLSCMTDKEVEEYITKDLAALEEYDKMLEDSKIADQQLSTIRNLRNRMAEGFSKNFKYIKEQGRVPDVYKDLEIL